MNTRCRLPVCRMMHAERSPALLHIRRRPGVAEVEVSDGRRPDWPVRRPSLGTTARATMTGWRGDLPPALEMPSAVHHHLRHVGSSLSGS